MSSSNLFFSRKPSFIFERQKSRPEIVSNKLVGAIDEGTSSARFILFRCQSKEIVASHQVSLGQTCPKEGWVEQDPIVILNAVYTCINETMKKLKSTKYDVNDIIAIGVTNQRESTIVWDKDTGEPLHNSIVWLDVRTASTVDQLLDSIPNKTRNKNYLKPLCGLPISPYFSALKLRWLYDNVASVKTAMNQGRCLFGTVDSWIIWNLTGGVESGVHATDVTNASRTMLMNIDRLKWDPTLIKFFGVPASILPTIKSSSEIYGYIKSGPLEGIPISGCLGDQQAALVGQQCLSRGQAKATYGTGCFLLYNTGNARVESNHGLITTVAYQIGSNQLPVYALEGSVAVAGAALSWLKNNLELISDVSEVQNIAEEAKKIENGEVYFVPAFSGLYAPYWQQDARGVICGITEDTHTSHIVRAALEAVSFQTRDILEAMAKDCGFSLTELQVDGGMTANNLLMQLQSDLAGLTVTRPEMTESTSFGVAMMAAAAVGHWDLSIQIPIPGSKFVPKCTKDERDIRYSKWKMAVERAGGWVK